MRARLNRAEWAAIVFATLVAHGFLAHELLYPSAADARQYANIGREMVEGGVLQRFTAAHVRTYGYPFFLSLVYRGAGALRLPFEVALFGLQLLQYVGVCLLFRQALARLSPFAARVALCGLLANPYVLIYAPQSLTESLSASLLVLVGAIWLHLLLGGWRSGLVLGGSLTVGAAVMVRPGNVFMVVAWGLGLLIVGRHQRAGAARLVLGGVLAAAGVGLPALPQMANNVREFGQWTPLLVADLGRWQEILGIENLKYATAVRPLPTATVFYENPFSRGTKIDEERPWRWYLANPGRGALTLGLHTFNLVDQDLLFTYSRDLDPWYRLPLGVLNHAAVGLGVLGLLLLVRGVMSRRKAAEADALIVLGLTIAGNWAMYCWTAVEMRYGCVLLLVLFPLAGYAATSLLRRRDTRIALATGAGLILYVAASLLLSGWVRDQAPLIRQARAARVARYVGAPDAALGAPQDERQLGRAAALEGVS
jgi:hypothetical protein